MDARETLSAEIGLRNNRGTEMKGYEVKQANLGPASQRISYKRGRDTALPFASLTYDSTKRGVKRGARKEYTLISVRINRK